VTEYGLHWLRDDDGDLKIQEHTFSFNGEEVDIELRPPTLPEFEELEEFQKQEEIDPEEVESVIEQFLVEPNISKIKPLTFLEARCYIDGIVDYAMHGNDLDEEIRDGVEDLPDEAGN